MKTVLFLALSGIAYLGTGSPDCQPKSSAKAAETAVNFSPVIIAGYTLSSITVFPDHPAMNCIIRGPADIAAIVTVQVSLYDSATSDPADPSTAPYGLAVATRILPANGTVPCDVNNGPQPLPPNHGPLKRIVIQLTATQPTALGNVTLDQRSILQGQSTVPSDRN